MTRRDILESVHEPFGDAFYYGPEFLSDRFRDDAAGREASGFSHKTYKDVLDEIMESGKVRDYPENSDTIRDTILPYWYTRSGLQQLSDPKWGYLCHKRSTTIPLLEAAEIGTNMKT